MLEAEYQALLIPKIKLLAPSLIDVLKNDSGYRQGIPDLSVFCGPYWAWLEVKISVSAPHEPNQEWYVNWAMERGFGAFIYPENEEEVLHAMARSFKL